VTTQDTVTAAYCRDERVLWRQGYDAVLLLPPGHSQVMSLVGGGTALWELLSEPHTVEAAAARLAAMYDTRAEDIAQDIRPVLDELARCGVVRRIEP